MLFLTSAKKATLLEGLRMPNESLQIETIQRSKTNSNSEQINTLISTIKHSNEGKRIGVLPKDIFGGEFYEEWQAMLKRTTLEQVDIQHGIGIVLAVKDEMALVGFS